MYRYVFDGYQERDGDPAWLLKFGDGQAGKIVETDGLTPSLYVLDNLIGYLTDPGASLKPAPAELLDFDRDGDATFDVLDADVALRRYWGEEPSGAPVQVVRYYHNDHLGAPTHVTDSAGDLVSHARFHPYGASSDLTGDQPIFGFAGIEIDREDEWDLGLIRMGARWYAPKLGRWVSVDPLFLQEPNEGVESVLEVNLYGYAAGNPVVFVDRTGLGRKEVEAARRGDYSGFTDFSASTVDASAALSGGAQSAGPVVRGATTAIDNVVSVLPGPGDVADAVEVAGDIRNGDYAAATVGGLAAVIGSAKLGKQAAGWVGDQVRKGWDKVRGWFGGKGGLPDDAIVARGGANITPESIAAGTGTHPSGVTGFSAECSGGTCLTTVGTQIPNDKMGVTTVGDVRDAGGDVVKTSGRSPHHVTVKNLDPDDAARLLNLSIPNPVPKAEREVFKR